MFGEFLVIVLWYVLRIRLLICVFFRFSDLLILVFLIGMWGVVLMICLCDCFVVWCIGVGRVFGVGNVVVLLF